MSLCIAAGGKILALAASTFSLSWTHSVERTLWEEQWVAIDGRLKVIQGHVQGSGAGIDLPENARRTEGGWVYTPALGSLDELSLAASGATASGWTLCTQDQCLELGAKSGEAITIWTADRCARE